MNKNNNISSIEVVALKKQIDEAIEQEEYDKAETLSQRLCKMQNLDTDVDMSDDFLFQLKSRERNSRKMNIKKSIVKVAAALVIVGVSGGSVYAGVSHYNSVKTVQHGLISSQVSEAPASEKKLDVSNDEISDGDTKVKVVSKEEGTASDKWLTKEVRTETTKGYVSDDGKKWDKDTLDVEDVTEYTYPDQDTACEDQNFLNVLSKEFTQDGDVTYTESRSREDETSALNVLKASFKYNNGQFNIETQKKVAKNINDIENSKMMVITTTGETTNERTYTSSNGVKYQMSDDEETGVTRTTTMISKGRYTAIVTFTGLSDDEIHNVLDAIELEK